MDRGDIDLKPGKNLPRMDVHTRSGDIDLALPPGAKFDLRATTEHGEADNEYGDPLREDSFGPRRNHRGKHRRRAPIAAGDRTGIYYGSQGERRRDHHVSRRHHRADFPPKSPKAPKTPNPPLKVEHE